MTVYPDWKRPSGWSNEPIDLATRRIDELEKRIKLLSTRVYELERSREKSEEALEEERRKAQTDLSIASVRLLQAVECGGEVPGWVAAGYRAALKRCNDLGLGLSE